MDTEYFTGAICQVHREAQLVKWLNISTILCRKMARQYDCMQTIFSLIDHYDLSDWKWFAYNRARHLPFILKEV